VVDWISANALAIVISLATIAALAIAATVVLWVQWRIARRRFGREQAQRLDLDREVLDLDIALAEQTGRLRIIRELHEVVVHEMSVLISQADGAQYAGAKDPKAAVRASPIIAEAGRSILASLRRVMAVVRDGDAAIDTQPQLKSSRDLFKVMGDAGLDVEFTETGTPFELRSGADLTIYRILEESLDNALKHGGHGTHVAVSFSWTEDGFTVSVDDDGIRAASRRDGLDPNVVSRTGGYELDDDLKALTGVVSGAGITEMRERTEIFGGVFTAQAVPGVGFSVAASFPALRYHNGVHGVNLDA
jgi:signal transduction histidine kinase